MIKPYYQDESYTQYSMDCEIGMKELPENSIDLIVTDPPYGYSFMGKDWDKAVPSVAKWRECLRLLKPGAFAFIMSAPRQDVLSRMIVNLQDAGFDTAFTSIYWAYASGFPKAMNIGKMVDKQLGVEREKVRIPITPHSTAGKGSSNEIDERPWLTKARELGYNETDGNIPMSDEAKALDGSYGGFQPKPAVEVIIVAMKPLSEKTYVGQALENGKGITWLDNCRIPFDSNDNALENGLKRAEKPRNDIRGGNFHVGEHDNHVVQSGMSQLGRFPANLLVSDDVLNDGSLSKQGTFKPRSQTRTATQFNPNNGWHDHNMNPNNATAPDNYGDSGSFSRYFDLDKWWAERIKSLPESVQVVYPFLIVPKASKSEKNIGCDELEEKIGGGMQGTQDQSLLTGSGNIRNNRARNNHPTVKPIKLMSYLITLGSRAGDTVLDPFIGSGTTARACKVLGRKCIGFEIDVEQYSKIAECRQNKVQVVMNFEPVRML